MDCFVQDFFAQAFAEPSVQSMEGRNDLAFPVGGAQLGATPFGQVSLLSCQTYTSS